MEGAAGEGADGGPGDPAAAAVFPLADLQRDVLVTSLGLLGALDLAAAGTASRTLFLVAGEVQRRPELIAGVGTPGKVLQSLGERLAATPTLGLVFGTGDLSAPELERALARRLPAGCQLVGAATPALQALAPALASVGGQTELHHVQDEGQITLMLGSFPDAVARAFHVPAKACTAISRASSDAAAAQAIMQLDLPTGDDWKTVVLIPAGGYDLNPRRIVHAYQRCCPNAALIGGMTGGQLLLHTLGKTRILTSGVVGLAMRGEVPLTALVSRGCSPLSPPMLARGASILESGGEAAGDGDDDEDEGEDEEKARVLVVPELVMGEGATVKPIEVAIKAQEASRHTRTFFSGVRLAPGAGYILEGVSQASFVRGGGMRVGLGGGDLGGLAPLPRGAEGAGRPSGPAPEHCEVRFFALSPTACKEDLQRLLGYVKAQCEENDEQVLGSVMFTCSGRTQRFFDEDCADAKRFREAFPSAPMVGFWAGGEIGPRALAEAGPGEATRTGNAEIQGFTAVFGIFRAPKPSRRTLLATLADEQVPAEVGASLARLSQDAKERGNAAFREADARNAVSHYTRAVDLAAVPSAALAPDDRAVLLANRALARLKLEDFEAAREDAEAAVSLDPSSAKVHYRRAQALLGLKRAEDAAACLRSAVALLPDEKALADLLAKVEQGAK